MQTNMTEMDENITANDDDEVTVPAASVAAAADDEDDAEGILVDADNDASCSDDDDDGVEVIGEDQGYYDEDAEMTSAQHIRGDAFYITTTTTAFSCFRSFLYRSLPCCSCSACWRDCF